MPPELPPGLEPYRARIEATLRPSVRLEYQAGAPGLRDSKVGGVAYWPKGLKYPVDAEGTALYLLAQLNLNELPKLEGFPQSGMLQFFIGGKGEYGANLSTRSIPEAYRVVYHPQILEDDAQLERHDPTPHPKDLPLDPTKPKRLKGTLEMQAKSVAEADFEQVTGIVWEDIDEDGELHMAYQEQFGHGGSRYGGYPYFTQDDARPEGQAWTLVFQLDTDSALGVMWGDMGIANFFVPPQALEQADFSKVLYTWDCL